jgi:nickel-type superoxide dismutase maturation protease
MIFVRRVVGDSMAPTLTDRQIVWFHQLRKFSVGQIVVAFIDGREVIKRIAAIENGRVFLVGDNEEHSTDSRHYGSVTDTKIEGILFWPRNLK